VLLAGVEVLGEEQGGPVQCLYSLVERFGEDLEHVRRPGGDVEDDVDVRLAGALGEPHRVVQEQLVRAGLEQNRREAGQVRVDRGASIGWLGSWPARYIAAVCARDSRVNSGSMPALVGGPVNSSGVIRLPRVVWPGFGHRAHGR
jgi:hypothetical protein